MVYQRALIGLFLCCSSLPALANGNKCAQVFNYRGELVNQKKIVNRLRDFFEYPIKQEDLKHLSTQIEFRKVSKSNRDKSIYNENFIYFGRQVKSLPQKVFDSETSVYIGFSSNELQQIQFIIIKKDSRQTIEYIASADLALNMQLQANGNEAKQFRFIRWLKNEPGILLEPHQSIAGRYRVEFTKFDAYKDFVTFYNRQSQIIRYLEEVSSIKIFLR